MQVRGVSGHKHSRVLIIGSGAAGMLAAISAKRAAQRSGRSCSVTVLERTPHSGTKIRISGGGKCNVTHSGTPGELLGAGFFRLRERRFLRPAVYGFSNRDLLDLLQSKGVVTGERSDGKVFPLGGDALTVVEAFEKMLRELSVQQFFSTRVEGVELRGKLFHAKTTDGNFFTSDAVILATGGLSYAQAGTTGDGIALACSLGHSIQNPSPALAPLFTIKVPPASLSGVSLRSISLVASAQGGMRSERRGDLLFTHRGFSGPAALSLSRDISDLATVYGNVSLFADLFPEQSVSELEEEFLKHAGKNGAQMVRKYLQSCPIAPHRGAFAITPDIGTIPASFVALVMKKSALDNDVTWSRLDKVKRRALLAVLKQFPLGMVRDVSLDKGEVSAGGVSLEEVNPKTMESRIVPGLFICGELLDYAGEIGGYNLQAAFSTGWMAGKNAAGN